MCTATLGAMPVNRWTCAASATFSCTVRGTPGWVNTLKRVPVLPNAQDGSSIRCALSAVFTAVRSRMSGSSPGSKDSTGVRAAQPAGPRPPGSEVELADVGLVEDERRPEQDRVIRPDRELAELAGRERLPWAVGDLLRREVHGGVGREV